MTDTRDANRLLRPFPFHSNSLAMAFDCFAHFDTLSFDCFALRNHATQCNAQAPTLRTTSLPIRSVIANAAQRNGLSRCRSGKQSIVCPHPVIANAAQRNVARLTSLGGQAIRC